MVPLKLPLFLALDLDSDKKALELAEKLQPYVGGYKIGPRLTNRYGSSIIKKLADLAPVFVDHKYYDIPSTMEASVQALFDAGASFVTVHAQSGSEALEKMGQLEVTLNQKRPFVILSVTILTSFSQKTAPPNWKTLPFLEQVESLSDLSVRCGLGGLVCSPEEVSAIRRRHPNAFIVTPGIRLLDTEAKDQKRVGTPLIALQSGSSALVVGRPIIEASDPVAEAKNFAEEMAKYQPEI